MAIFETRWEEIWIESTRWLDETINALHPEFLWRSSTNYFAMNGVVLTPQVLKLAVPTRHAYGLPVLPYRPGPLWRSPTISVLGSWTLVSNFFLWLTSLVIVGLEKTFHHHGREGFTSDAKRQRPHDWFRTNTFEDFSTSSVKWLLMENQNKELIYSLVSCPAPRYATISVLPKLLLNFD